MGYLCTYFRTIMGKFTLIVLILIASTGAVLLHERNGMVRSWREEQIRNAQAGVRLQAATLDHTTRLLEETLLNLSIGNPIFDEFPSFGEPNSYAGLRLVVRMRSLLSSLSTVFPFLESTYVYYPERDFFLNYGINPQLSQQICSLVQGRKRGDEDSPSNGLWNTLQCNGSTYLVLLYQTPSYCIGAWTTYDSLLLSLSQGEEEGYLTDSSGLPLTSRGQAEGLLASPSQEIDQRDGKVWISSFSLHPGLYLLRSLSQEELLPPREQFQTPFLLLLALGLLWVGFVALCLYHWVLRPIQSLSRGIETVSKGDIAYRLPLHPSYSQEFQAIEQEFNQMLGRIEHLRIQFYEQELEHKETKLRYLGQQVQPHFILNALNTLYTCTERDIKETQKIILLLSRYFRFVVNVESRYVPLSQELEHLENYLSVQKVRFPTSLSYQIQVDPGTGSTPIPPFLLENFIGNCIKYGQNDEGKTRIHLRVERLPEGEGIRIEIRDEGNGFPDEVLEAISEFLQTGEKLPLFGIGIYNCCERLSLLYGSNASIKFSNAAQGGAWVEILLCGAPS